MIRATMTLGLLCSLFLLIGCNKAYYNMWEKFGYEKRHLLVSEVEDAKDSQEKAKEQFKTTLERFTELTKFEGGELQAKYKKLNAEYERSKSRAEAVSEHIADVDTVAQDMFKEWKQELQQYESADLRSKSEQQLNQSRQRYDELISAMRRAEAKMQPVLKAFGDQVLFLKHNLNAQAIASLQTTTAQIDSDVQALIKDMEASINEANEFISQMKT
jgi:chromosome segregation ATPase